MPASMLPATVICTPPWNPLLPGLPAWKAPPARMMRSVTSRPWSGSSTIRSCSTTELMPALRTSTRGAAASTDTVSSRFPTASSVLIVGVAPTCSTRPVWT